MIDSDLRIDSFLRFGYFCDFDNSIAPIDFSNIDKRLYESATKEELISHGVNKLKTSVASLWQGQREHVVPLSGGLDSRLILGVLLEHISAKQLHTYTYGIPGSYDFEIANSVARTIGTRHQKIPLCEELYSERLEKAAAKRTYCQGILFHHPPFSLLDRMYADALIWSGFVGDAVAGSYLESRPSRSFREAQVRHLENRVFVQSMRLNRCSDEEFLTCMAPSHIGPNSLTFDEQVLFSEAVPKFTAPLVLFSGFEFVTPFINTPWMDFMFSVPNRYRFRQELMIDICLKAFPRLFNMPSKNRLGHTFGTPDAVVKSTFWLNRARKLLHNFFPRINWPNIQIQRLQRGSPQEIGFT